MCLIKVTLQLLHLLSPKKSHLQQILGVQTVKKQCSACPNDMLDALRLSPCPSGLGTGTGIQKYSNTDVDGNKYHIKKVKYLSYHFIIYI